MPGDLLFAVAVQLGKERNCKFSGRDCAFSHGVEVPLADLLPDPHDRKKSATTVANTSLHSSSEGDDWLASLRAGSRVLARYHDRVWYEAAAEGPATGGSLAVCFKGFEDDGPVVIPADHAHLAPLDTGANGLADARGNDGGLGASPGSDGEESDLEDAWADAPSGDDGEGNRFFQERVLDGRGGGGNDEGARGEDAEGGLCSDAYVFGDWEMHTKGFGSRMMSRMGYRRGEGLGSEKQVRFSCYVQLRAGVPYVRCLKETRNLLCLVFSASVSRNCCGYAHVCLCCLLPLVVSLNLSLFILELTLVLHRFVRRLHIIYVTPSPLTHALPLLVRTV